MRAFAELYEALDETTSTLAKREALAEFFRTTAAADAAWAVQLLSGSKLPRLIHSGGLRELAAEITGYPDWLIDESYAHVGDLAECLTLLVQPFAETCKEAAATDMPLHEWIERIRAAALQTEAQRREWLKSVWLTLPHAEDSRSTRC